MKRILVTMLALLVTGCWSNKPPEPARPPSADASDFIHRVEHPGETLGEIARWHTGKFQNWKKLARPVNPGLTRCCTALRVGREVKIPRELVVRTEPMPKPEVVTRPSKPLVEAEPAKPTKDAGSALPATRPAPGVPPKDADDDAEKEAKRTEEEPSPAAPVAEAVATPPAEEPPAPAANAAGKVNFKGQSWKAADAIAYVDVSKVDIALSDKRFDRKAMSKDGKVDSFDVLNHRMNLDASTITLRVDGDGKVNCFDYSVGGGGGSNCGTTTSTAWKPGARTNDAIGGSFAFADGADAIDVTFDVPILRDVKRAGQSLPAGGGEPGKAVLARFAANLSGDLDKIMALTNPEQRKEMDAHPLDASEKKMMIDFMKATTPTRAKILGGVVDGDSATVDFEGTIDGENARGTAEANRVGGKWYVGAVSTKQ